MVRLAQPIMDAMAHGTGENFRGRRIYMGPRGTTLTTATARELARERGVDMPIVEQLNLVLGGKDPRQAVSDLMGRPSRHENERIWLKEQAAQKQ